MKYINEVNELQTIRTMTFYYFQLRTRLGKCPWRSTKQRYKGRSQIEIISKTRKWHQPQHASRPLLTCIQPLDTCKLKVEIKFSPNHVKGMTSSSSQEFTPPSLSVALDNYWISETIFITLLYHYPARPPPPSKNQKNEWKKFTADKIRVTSATH